MPNIGYTELLIILALALLFFGAKRIPEVAKSLGRSINAFKVAGSGMDHFGKFLAWTEFVCPK